MSSSIHYSLSLSFTAAQMIYSGTDKFDENIFYSFDLILICMPDLYFSLVILILFKGPDGIISKVSDIQQQFEDTTRKCVADARHLKQQLVDMSNNTSTKRNSLEQHSGHQTVFELMRENDGIAQPFVVCLSIF